VSIFQGDLGLADAACSPDRDEADAGWLRLPLVSSGNRLQLVDPAEEALVALVGDSAAASSARGSGHGQLERLELLNQTGFGLLQFRKVLASAGRRDCLGPLKACGSPCGTVHAAGRELMVGPSPSSAVEVLG